MPIIPARLAFAADGTPRSADFDDVYHSHDGGLGQSRHVFLGGNGLPARWQGRERFVVLETGFGLGLNFLATWQAWRDDPARCGRLHFVSCELHPFTREDLATLHGRWPELAPLAEELRAQWPALVPGLHRLHFDGGGVTLTLFFGDALGGLPRIDAAADALYLDGFAPAKNPDLWSAKLFHLLSRHCAAGATLATWSVAGAVRESLRRAGFQVEKAPGFGGKREMLRGMHGRHPADAAVRPSEARTALVLGAGAAGSSAAERLADRGWQVELIEAAAAPGQGASGNHAGVLRPLPSLDDNRLSRLTRAGALYALRHLARLAALGQNVRFDACGVLHLARDDEQERKQRAVVERLQFPEDLLAFVTREQASVIAGWPVTHGGWWFAGSGWVQPPSLCRANLAAHPQRIRCHFGRRVAHLERRHGIWHALAEDGSTIAHAPVAVLGNGADIVRLPQAQALPVRSARGQVSLLEASSGTAPRVVVCRGGYVSPAVDGLRCAGATFDVGDRSAELRLADHEENLRRLEGILPGYTDGLDPAALRGRVGFRPASPDRLPMVGALPALTHLEHAIPLHDIPRHEGLYAVSGFGARGIVWSALMGELIASQICGDPLPVERDLVEAVDPARYLLRPARGMREGED